MNELDQLSYLDSVEVFTSTEEFRWEDDAPKPSEDYIMDNDYCDDF
jgi:hypothetical protein